MKILLLLMALSWASWSYGLSISNIKRNYSVSKTAPVHVFVVGYSGELGSLFFSAATSRAKKYAELYPNDRIVLIGPGEKSPSYYRRLLKRMGWKPKYIGYEKLSAGKMLHQMKKLGKGKIRSFNLFAHTAIVSGAGLDKKGSTLRFNAYSKGVKALKAWFSRDAYAYLHGCNSGQSHAPKLSRLWNIPVAGSFGATDFQDLRSDKEWYFGYKGFYPKETTLAQENTESFQQVKSCYSGACSRMNPADQPYDGYWGKFKAGLGIYKFFCRLQGNNSMGRCTKAMARSLYGYVGGSALDFSSGYDEYRKIAIEFLCPPKNHTKLYEKCVKAIYKTESDGVAASYIGMMWGREIKEMNHASVGSAGLPVCAVPVLPAN